MNFLQSLNPFASTTAKPLASSTIAELRVYPIKSCRGISLPPGTPWRLTRQGLDLDRTWMIVDAAANNTFQTIRQIAELTLFDTAFAHAAADDTANGVRRGELLLVVSIRNAPSRRIVVPARPSAAWLAQHTRLERVDIWGTDTDGHVYGDDVNAFFREFLGRDSLCLVRKGDEPRMCEGNASEEQLGRAEKMNFPDMMPVLVANKASIAELNSRLLAKGHYEIEIERFRPNIVVQGGEEHGMGAWSEDAWWKVRVVTHEKTEKHPEHALEIDVPARCARCQVPNVNPETAEKDKKQPWETLMSYRRIDPGVKYKPCFGMLCCPKDEGMVRVGMKFDVLEITDNHLFGRGY